jgi:hypothetical protein
MMRAFGLTGLMLFFCAACDGQGSSPGENGLEGMIKVSPAHPGPAREGVPSSAPLADAAFTVESAGKTAASFTTNGEGHFRVTLPPGHYTVKINGRRIRRCGPFEVDVVAGKMTTVEWQCDTGMR